MALSGATWLAIGFAGTYALRVVPALAALPLAVLEAGAAARIAGEAIAGVVTLALEVAVLVLCIRRAGVPAEKPPWTTIIVTSVVAVLSYTLSAGAGLLTATLGARSLEPEGMATLAYGNGILSMIGGVLHLVLLIGVIIAVALRWQRESEAGPKPAGLADGES